MMKATGSRAAGLSTGRREGTVRDRRAEMTKLAVVVLIVLLAVAEVLALRLVAG